MTAHERGPRPGAPNANTDADHVGSHGTAADATNAADQQAGADFLMDDPESHEPPTDYRKIHERHVSMIRAAGISPAVADKTVISQNGSLLFNYRRPDGTRFTVTRPDNGTPAKYVHPPGGRGLNVHPSVSGLMTDVKAPLVMTEGTKQYLAVVSAVQGKRVFPVGMSGIRNWQWKPGGNDTPSVPLPDWGWIPLKGRTVYVIPDGDYATNPDVQTATDALMDALRGMGASAVHRVAVPLGPDGKTGVDDHLGALPENARTAELLRLMDEAEDDDEDVFLSRDDLDNMPGVEPLIKGVLNQRSIVWISGRYGTYKTFLALAWSCCIATGTPWEGREVGLTGPVVYVAAEGQSGLSGRLRAWEQTFNGGRRVENLITTRKGMDPRKPKQMAKLTRKIKKAGAVLVVFDTLHRCCPGMDENSAKEVGEAFGALERIKDETGCAVAVLHHTGYEGKRARGSSSQEDDADDAYVIERQDDGEGPRTLTRTKSKEGPHGQTYSLVLKNVDPFDADGDSPAYVTLADQDGAVMSRPRKETNVQRIMREMDEAGLPVDLSVRGARGWLAARGNEIKGRSIDWETAHRARKERDPSPLPGPTAPGDRETADVSLVSPSEGDS
ncbi:AAA family ATPase [Streptomyces dubilierae]|uniref:AAA family ATPase n=1 Tax=Streptomyces dubilierae TaxID=3075533 RepID=A0ABU2P6Y2_9ACTN|nr:AAA family ATPase [Streptomyces sp. DSM 41921]MDT0387913.1 AAA family ATPase [Streptomyces sp. DSM 41921]